MNLRDISINTSLALTGIALWSYGAGTLASGGDFDYQPNPLGLKRSPYGQVVALAMQGGIDADWHGTERSSEHPSGGCGQDHETLGCAHVSQPQESFIERVANAATERTNPRPASPAHKFYLRRQVENRLRLAYELDPSNYANYNSYNLFLTEPAVGTRRVLTDDVLSLARQTIEYGLHETCDPRPALTAAAAAGNILELMFLHREDHTVDEMKSQLQLLDQSLDRHRALTRTWLDSGDFERLSPARQQEMLERMTFVMKVREAAAQTIRNLETPAPDQALLRR